MEGKLFDVKEAPWKVILLFLVASTVMVSVINLVLFPGPLFDPIARATGGLVDATLQANLLNILLFSLIVFGWGKLRPKDVGLDWGKLGQGLSLTALLWVAAQAVVLLINWINGDIHLDPVWSERGVTTVIGGLIAQLLGNAFFEEMEYRGFYLSQFYLKIKTQNEGDRRIWSVLAMLTLFILSHIPNRIFSGYTLADIPADFALLCRDGRIAVLIIDEPTEAGERLADGEVREALPRLGGIGEASLAQHLLGLGGIQAAAPDGGKGRFPMGLVGLGRGKDTVELALNAAAVARLRQRKLREEKPFAVMSPDLDAIRAYAVVEPDDETLLRSIQRPIVLLRKNETGRLAEEVAPRNPCVGAMLPYTPLHHLLLAHGFAALVMTSGNLSEEPIAIDNDDAFERPLRHVESSAHAQRLHRVEVFRPPDPDVFGIHGRSPRWSVAAKEMSTTGRPRDWNEAILRMHKCHPLSP